MKISSLRAVTAALVISICSTAWLVRAAEPTRQPDVARGAKIAAQGTSNGVTACAQCHAFNGSSDGTGAFPRIAGQSAMYLSKQLNSYASNERLNAVMSPVAKGLSADDIADVAAYYAGVTGPYLPLAAVNPALLKRGEELAVIGDATKNLQSCNNCHGPNGAGELPAIPYLAGQYAHYTAFQLRMWKSGFRKTSPDGMGIVANKLSDADIEAVAAYFQQIRAGDQSGAQRKD
jgi:cytochrome c553